MRIGITGSRRRNTMGDYALTCKKFYEIYQVGDTIVSGGCSKGGDSFAERLAREHQIPILIHRPKWRDFGPSAGLIRNTDIAKDADVLIAVVAADRKGGTEDTIRKFRKLKPDGLIHLV
jgi:hypothetical protein